MSAEDNKRLLEYLTQSINTSEIKHFILLFDEQSGQELHAHTFDSLPQLRKVLEHVIARIKSGKHERSRVKVPLEDKDA